MKRFILILSLLVFFVSSANAAFTIPKDEETAIRFNAWAKRFGAPAIDKTKVYKEDNMAAFQMDGYDIIFIWENDLLNTIGIRLADESAAGDFLSSCMTVISAFGEMDYTAFGMLLFQYGTIKSGESATLPYYVAGDAFSIDPNQESYKYVFVYMNTNEESSF